MGLGAGIVNAIHALARGAYDAQQAKKLGPDFRSILAAQNATRDLNVQKLQSEIPSAAEEQAHEQAAVAQSVQQRQAALRTAVENAANMEPDLTVTGMGDVGTPPTPDTADNTQYTAPDGLGVSNEAFGAMARGARTERKSALAMQKAAADQARAIATLRARGLNDQQIEQLRQEGRLELEATRQTGRMDVVSTQQAGANARTAATVGGAMDRTVATEAGKTARAGAGIEDRGLGGVIYNLQQRLRTEPDEDVAASIKARIEALTVERERNARRRPVAPPSTTGNPAPPGQPNPAAAVKPAAAVPSPAPKAAAAPAPVKSRAEVDALPDGALFVLNGRTFRKQGNTAVPVQ